MKHISQKTIDTLAAMTDWVTAMELAVVRNTSRSPTARALDKLYKKGLIEIAPVNDGVLRHKYRRTAAGSALIGTFIPNVAQPKEPEVPRTGANPFEWRSFKQPVPWRDDPYPNQHREVSEKATFWI